MSSIHRRGECLPWRSMDNDGIHKFAYRLGAMFADLLRLAVPALAAELDFTRAELLPTSHVAVAGTRFKQRHGDMTWRVPYRRDAAQDGSPSHLIVVVEYLCCKRLFSTVCKPTILVAAGRLFGRHRVGAGSGRPMACAGWLPWRGRRLSAGPSGLCGLLPGRPVAGSGRPEPILAERCVGERQELAHDGDRRPAWLPLDFRNFERRLATWRTPRPARQPSGARRSATPWRPPPSSTGRAPPPHADDRRREPPAAREAARRRSRRRQRFRRPGGHGTASSGHHDQLAPNRRKGVFRGEGGVSFRVAKGSVFDVA